MWPRHFEPVHRTGGGGCGLSGWTASAPMLAGLAKKQADIIGSHSFPAAQSLKKSSNLAIRPCLARNSFLENKLGWSFLADRARHGSCLKCRFRLVLALASWGTGSSCEASWKTSSGNGLLENRGRDCDFLGSWLWLWGLLDNYLHCEASWNQNSPYRNSSVWLLTVWHPEKLVPAVGPPLSPT